jgi:nucleoid DNA-binding protein
LKPQKVKNLIPELSQKLQLSELEIKSVLDVYWDKIRKTLSSLDHNRLYLKGLGTFYVKPWRLDTRLKINNALVDRYVNNPTASGLHIMNNLLKDNLKIEKVKEREKEYDAQRQEKKHKRRNQDLEGEG